MTLRASDGVAGFAGLQTCGSVWACPCCGGKILTHRALEIGAVLSEAIAQGHSLGFFTLTMRHRKGQSLETLWGAGQKAWKRAISGKGWVLHSEAGGVVGWVRVWEVTTGANGWHVHVHGVVVLGPDASDDDLDRLLLGMYGRWGKGLVAAGLSTPLLRGQEWHLVRGDQAADDVAGYLFKIAEGEVDRATGLGLELTHSQPGRSRRALATAPVSHLVDEFRTTGDADVLAQWHEWERVSKGKRQVGFSRGLRDRFAPTVPDLSDDQVADLEHGTSHDDLLHLGPDAWRMVVADPALPPLLLDLAETEGVAGVRAALVDRGIPHSVCSRPSDVA